MPNTLSQTPKPITSYVIVLDPVQIETLAEWCESHGWSFFDVAYAHYGYKQEGVNLVVYKSGKLSIQGKNTHSFVTDILEPFITKKFSLGFERTEHPEWFLEHAGMDESGKGDLFGPLVTACVIANENAVDFWLKNGLKESKAIHNDTVLFKMEKLVKTPENVVIELAYAGMDKYNQLYSKFGNLNELLAWLHAKALGKALTRRPTVHNGLLDQFTQKKLVEKYIDLTGFALEQHVRAETDPVVAAASIAARAEYVRQLKTLSESSGVQLPKGCSTQAKQALQELIQKQGKENLKNFAKLHFKTVSEVI